MNLRCACRPGCLSWLDPRDRTVLTSDGEALASHVAVQPYPEALAPQYDADRLDVAL